MAIVTNVVLRYGKQSWTARMKDGGIVIFDDDPEIPNGAGDSIFIRKETWLEFAADVSELLGFDATEIGQGGDSAISASDLDTIEFKAIEFLVLNTRMHFRLSHIFQTVTGLDPECEQAAVVGLSRRLTKRKTTEPRLVQPKKGYYGWDPDAGTTRTGNVQ